MSLQSQIIAALKGEKPKAEDAFTKAFRASQRLDPLSGIQRQYTPNVDTDYKYPDEGNNVQYTVQEQVNAIPVALSRYLDLQATLDWGNAAVKANVEVDGQIIIADAPPTFLIFLEKQLGNVIQFLTHVATLQPGIKWEETNTPGVYRSPSVKTAKTKRTLKGVILAEATVQHPAQVKPVETDDPIGTWDTVKLSGAMPESKVEKLLVRTRKLHEAVKAARIQANANTVDNVKVAQAIFDYLNLGGE